MGMQGGAGGKGPDAKKAADDELNEKKAKHEKRIRDRAMFREQAMRQNETFVTASDVCMYISP